MKINKFSIENHITEPVNGVSMTDCLFMFVKSRIIFTVNGVEQQYPPKTVIIYKSGAVQNYRPVENEAIVCDKINFKMNFSDMQYVSSLEIPIDTPVSLADDIIIRNVFKCIHAESLCFGPRKNEFSEYALRMMLIGINEQLKFAEKSEKSNVPHYKELKKLREKIYSEPVLRWNIDEICNRLNMSRTYFHRIYFSAFGVTCLQDVINSRLSFAEEILINSDLSVSEIAEKCGYESDSYFMRQFKKTIGCTPSEYRRRFSDCKDIGDFKELVKQRDEVYE